MQDALPAFVLNSETLPRTTMNETSASPTNSSAPPESQRPGLSDERLMLAFSQGSSEAFTELFHRYKQPVFGFFCRRLADPANAEELTQETFFALLRAAARYKPPSAPRSSAMQTIFPIQRRPTPRNRACGSVAPWKSSIVSTAKSSCFANSSN